MYHKQNFHKVSKYLFFIFIILFTINSLHYFSKNFLLKRNKIIGKEEDTWKKFINESTDSSNPRKNRVILFIIDALRFDFIQRIPTIKNSIEKEEGLIFKFRADPPTTTSQRLKSLLTGSLPVFIEQGENFNTEIITDQIFLQKNETVVLGDGTWAELLGTEDWLRMRTWPSFNVRDLDSVDNGILRYFHDEILYNENSHYESFASNKKNLNYDYSEFNPAIRDCIKNIENYSKLQFLYHCYSKSSLEEDVMGSILGFEPWKLLIAHFLGVDHAGHRHGVFHLEMDRKLRQMSNELEWTMKNMDNNTVLFVFGDHGMNDFGDHGGASDIEVNSALFVYSKFSSKNKIDDNIKTVSQLDFTATMSWILNLPIPFSNLGSIIPEVVTYILQGIPNSDITKIKVLHSNLNQVMNFINKYKEEDPLFISDKEYKLIINKYKELSNHSIISKLLDTDHLDESFIKNYELEIIEHLEIIANICRKQWAQFNLPNMLLGILSLFLIIIQLLFFSNKLIVPNYENIWQLSFIGILINLYSNLLLLIGHSVISPTNCIFISLIIITIQISYFNWKPIILSTKKKILIFSFLFNLFLSVSSISNSYLIFEDRIVTYLFLGIYIGFILIVNQNIEILNLRIFLYEILSTLLVSICTIVSRQMFRSRMHGTHHIDNSLLSNFFSFKFSLLLFIANNIIFLLYRFITKRMSIKNFNLSLIDELTMLIITTLVWCYWWIEKSNIKSKLIYMIPRSIYFIFIIQLLEFYIQRKYFKIPKKVCISYIYQSFLLIITMIKGYDYSVSTFALSLQVCILAYFIEWAYINSDVEKNESIQSIALYLWHFMGLQYYFAFGQQNTIDTIKWTAAFVGIQDFQVGIIQLLSGLLVVIGIYSSRLLHMLCISWILIDKKSIKNYEIKSNSQKKTNISGDEVETKSNECFFEILFILLLPPAFSCICAYIHRRHLMMWAIFAPKFIFESVGFLSIILIILLKFIFKIAINQITSKQKD